MDNNNWENTQNPNNNSGAPQSTNIKWGPQQNPNNNSGAPQSTNINWGAQQNTNSNWGAQQSTNNNWRAPQNTDNNWGFSSNSSIFGKPTGYHRGYATTLKVLGYIATFIIPLIVAIFLGSLVYEVLTDDFLATITGLITYIVLAFIIWMSVSYKINIFDNISKIAQNTDIMVSLLSKKDKEEK